jgi:flagellar basal-body rod protein FlgB
VNRAISEVFGIHDRAVLLRERRAELLSENLANADTPQYKARDLDFRALLDGAGADLRAGLATTHPRHIRVSAGEAGEGDRLYRIPSQPAIDGNTVDPDTERAAFLDNALRYQASLQFLDGRIKRLTAALRGE